MASPSDTYYITDGNGWRMVDGFQRHFVETSIEDALNTCRYYLDMEYGKEFHIYRAGGNTLDEDELVCTVLVVDEEVITRAPDIAV
jgi:hypothetical protein